MLQRTSKINLIGYTHYYPRGLESAIGLATDWVLDFVDKDWPFKQIDEFDKQRYHHIYHCIAPHSPRIKKKYEAVITPVEQCKCVFFPHDGIPPYWSLALQWQLPVKENLNKNEMQLSAAQQKYMQLVRDNIPIKSRKILEIGCGDGSLVSALSACGADCIVGIDYALNSKWKVSADDRGQHYDLFEMDATNLTFIDSSFDSIYSINVFEHIDDLKGALCQIARVLKPGGCLFTIFSPIWSARLGYHYIHWDVEISKHIPPWGHLYLTEVDMYREILASSKNEDLAQKASSQIYHRKGLNRLVYKEYLDLFRECKSLSLDFRLKEMLDHEYETYSDQIPKSLLGFKGLNVIGFIGTIRKI